MHSKNILVNTNVPHYLKSCMVKISTGNKQFEIGKLSTGQPAPLPKSGWRETPIRRSLGEVSMLTYTFAAEVSLSASDDAFAKNRQRLNREARKR